MNQEPFSVDSGGRTICGVLTLPARAEKPPCVITCHGLFSSKESDKFTEIARRFPAAGLAVIRFDFCGCGESAGHISETTVTRRLEDLTAVARFASGHPQLGIRRGLLGSSFGGLVALHFALENRVEALSVWAAPCDLGDIYENIPEEDLKQLRPEFFTDAENYRLPPVSLRAVQVVHGEMDEVVACRHAREIFARVSDPKQLIIIDGADHSIRSPAHREQALAAGLAWMQRFLLPGRQPFEK